MLLPSMKKLDLLPAILLVVILVSIPIIYADDLPSFFDEPCINGSPRDQAICTGVNALHDRIEESDVDILNLQNNLTMLDSELDIEIQSTNVDVDSLSNRTIALEQVQFVTYSEGNISMKFSLTEYEFTCPEGTVLTGGGNTRILSPSIVIDSHPFNNGWKIRINNNGAIDYGFTIYVICMTP